MNKKLLTFTAAYAAYVVFVNVVDGPWKQWDKGAVFDKWTLTHVAWGALAKRWGLTVEEILILSSMNEGIEAYIRAAYPELTFGSPESTANATFDVATTVAAYLATPEKKQ